MASRANYLRELSKSLVESMDDDVEELARFSADAVRDEKPITEGMVAIVRLLQDNLLLVAPTLNWVQQKIREMNTAQLRVLYTDEELRAMASRLSPGSEDAQETQDGTESGGDIPA